MQTVFVGLSGGVDSAVSAVLLKQQGFNVVGAFIKIWRPEFIECTWKEDRLDAMRVCASLEIPFKEIDLSEEYKKTVIDDMIANYARGITPNPDVLCNRHIKFGAFANWAFSEGADFVATGHYARVQARPAQACAGLACTTSLLRGKDTNKDQSYFLWQLTQKDLSRVLFPVGGYTKLDVRALAKKFNLPVARKADSQGLCFVGDVTMSEFLSHYMKVNAGNILDTAGKIVGTHEGAALYTIGQRHGFSVAAEASSEAPLYIINIDTRANTLTVSPDPMIAARKEVRLDDVNWVSKPPLPLRVHIQARYHEKPVPASVDRVGDAIIVTLDAPHIVSPGQSLVMFDREHLLGGGVITAQAP